MGHIRPQGLHNLSNARFLEGMLYIPINSKVCDSCRSKETIERGVLEESSIDEQNELMHSYLCGPFKHSSLGGSK
jgi:hypothetical protein